MSHKSTKLPKELVKGAKLVPIDPDISSVVAPEPDVLEAFLMQEATDLKIREHLKSITDEDTKSQRR
ncbi:hypothetical protein [Lacticaseibacillus porcinae]|uniref:hypothetical protein n=1 Tax=Lacticaseibacillus porcinae TaxID=1123687 RepID=UPI000F7AB3FD|nr:hypothetical protein [Lacticaseibacillus porcinae]